MKGYLGKKKNEEWKVEVNGRKDGNVYYHNINGLYKGMRIVKVLVIETTPCNKHHLLKDRKLL